jgi:hypothetical protein
MRIGVLLSGRRYAGKYFVARRLPFAETFFAAISFLFGRLKSFVAVFSAFATSSIRCPGFLAM